MPSAAAACPTVAPPRRPRDFEQPSVDQDHRAGRRSRRGFRCRLAGSIEPLHYPSSGLHQPVALTSAVPAMRRAANAADMAARRLQVPDPQHPTMEGDIRDSRARASSTSQSENRPAPHPKDDLVWALKTTQTLDPAIDEATSLFRFRTSPVAGLRGPCEDVIVLRTFSKALRHGGAALRLFAAGRPRFCGEAADLRHERNAITAAGAANAACSTRL